MNSVFEIAMEPVDRVAQRVASDSALDTASEADLEQLIVALMGRIGELKMKRVEVDCDLEESKQKYHTYGLPSPPGWFKSQKLEQEHLNHELARLGNSVDHLKRRISGKRLHNIGAAFMTVAREILDKEQFIQILTRAEMAMVIKSKNLTAIPKTE